MGRHIVSGGRLRAGGMLLALGAVISIAACGQSGSGNPVAPLGSAATITVAGTPVSLSAQNALALPVGEAETLSIPSSEGPASLTTTCPAGTLTVSGSPGTTFVLTGNAAVNCTVTLTNAVTSTTIDLTVTGAAAPTPTPTATPAPPMVSSSSLSFSGTGTTQQLTVTQASYTGVFTESNTCSGIATISPTSSSGPSAIFTVTSVSAGTCAVTFTGAGGTSTSVPITVTTLGVTVQSKAENR